MYIPQLLTQGQFYIAKVWKVFNIIMLTLMRAAYLNKIEVRFSMEDRKR